MREMLINKRHKALIPNSTRLLHGEADLLSVTKSNFVHEFEIKCNVADYRRDFRTKQWKHQRLEQNGSNWTHKWNPNYFWFVTYQFDIEPPAYAGWILVHGKKLIYKKAAPRLHSVKWTDKKIARIARLLSFRLLHEYERASHQALEEQRK